MAEVIKDELEFDVVTDEGILIAKNYVEEKFTPAELEREIVETEHKIDMYRKFVDGMSKKVEIWKEALERAKPIEEKLKAEQEEFMTNNG